MGFIRLIAGWFLGNWLTILMIAIVVASYTFVVYNKGYTSAQVSCVTKATAAITKGVKNHAKVKQQVNSMSESDIDAALSRFMRD